MRFNFSKNIAVVSNFFFFYYGYKTNSMSHLNVVLCFIMLKIAYNLYGIIIYRVIYLNSNNLSCVSKLACYSTHALSQDNKTPRGQKFDHVFVRKS